MGRTAVLHVDGSTLHEPNLLLLTTARSSPNSAHQLISNGVYVTRHKIFEAKGASAPRASYEPIASRLIPVDTPGATAAKPARFGYRNVCEGRFGMGPLEPGCPTSTGPPCLLRCRRHLPLSAGGQSSGSRPEP